MENKEVLNPLWKIHNRANNCHSQTWLWLWPSDGLETHPPPHHPTTPPQTFNCQYLSHFSTNWAEIFFGNPLEGISNDQTEEQAGAELGQAQCLA